MKQMKRILAIVVVVAIVAQAFLQMGVTTYASESSAYSAVKSAYGSSFPLTDSNLITTPRKNVFGKYSTVLGVSGKNFSSYKAARKAGKDKEYICAIFKAPSKKKAKKIVKSLKKYVSKEKSGNANYFSSYGKSLLNNAKVGRKGKYAYLFVLDTSKNSKAVAAFKKNV